MGLSASRSITIFGSTRGAIRQDGFAACMTSGFPNHWSAPAARRGETVQVHFISTAPQTTFGVTLQLMQDKARGTGA